MRTGGLRLYTAAALGPRVAGGQGGHFAKPHGRTFCLSRDCCGMYTSPQCWQGYFNGQLYERARTHAQPRGSQGSSRRLARHLAHNVGRRGVDLELAGCALWRILLRLLLSLLASLGCLRSGSGSSVKQVEPGAANAWKALRWGGSSSANKLLAFCPLPPPMVPLLWSSCQERDVSGLEQSAAREEVTVGACSGREAGRGGG